MSMGHWLELETYNRQSVTHRLISLAQCPVRGGQEREYEQQTHEDQEERKICAGCADGIDHHQ